jgi:hypothetical protein
MADQGVTSGTTAEAVGEGARTLAAQGIRTATGAVMNLAAQGVGALWNRAATRLTGRQATQPPSCKRRVEAEYRKFKEELKFLLVLDDELWARVFQTLNDQNVKVENSRAGRLHVAESLVRAMRAIVDETIEDAEGQCQEFLNVWEQFDLKDPLDSKHRLKGRFTELWKDRMVKFIDLVGEARRTAGRDFRDTIIAVHNDLNDRCPVVVRGTEKYRTYSQPCEDAIGRALRDLMPYATTRKGLRGDNEELKQTVLDMMQPAAAGVLMPL